MQRGIKRRKVEGTEGIEWGGGREEEWSVASAEEVESVSFIRIMLSFDKSILFNWEAPYALGFLNGTFGKPSTSNSCSLLYGNYAIEPVASSIIYKRIKSNSYNNVK